MMALVFWIISYWLVATRVEILVECTHCWATRTHIEIVDHATLTYVGISASRSLHTTF